MSIISSVRLVVLVLLFCSCNDKLYRAITNVEKQSKSHVIPDSLFMKNADQYELTIGYTSSNTSGTNLKQSFYIVRLGDNKNMAYRYEVKQAISVNSQSMIIDSVQIEKNIRMKILSEIINVGEWNLNYDDSKDDFADEYCRTMGFTKQCVVLHGITYNLVIKTKNACTSSRLYAPDIYETTCCSGNINRVKFLKLKSIIDGQFPKSE